MGEIKLKKRYKYAGDIFSKLIDIKFDVETATAFLNDIKDADVVEVVRCKSCVHYQNGTCNHFGYYTYAPDVDEDDFCSYGEKALKERAEQ